MTIPILTYPELEALHDVLEAARCYWHGKPTSHARAEETLRLANQLFWRLGEELPKSGSPSETFRTVTHSSEGDPVDEIVELALDRTREYNQCHDPWWADTIVSSCELTSILSSEQLAQLIGSFQRLGLTLELSDDIPADQIILERRDWGPWPEDTSR